MKSVERKHHRYRYYIYICMQLLLGPTKSIMYTVEPPNKGLFESGDFVLYLEAVLWWEV